jgi:FecR protein
MRSCPRSWEVEALRDGRLGGDARGNAQKHIDSCSVCSLEQRGFDDLARALYETSPADDEVALRRLRHRVLARVHETSSQEDVGTRHRSWWLASFAIAAVAIMGSTAWLVLRSPSNAAPVSLPSDDRETEVDATSDSIWSRAWESDRGNAIEHIRIESGDLRLNNPRKATDKSLVVSVPDGDIEDLGTVFRVIVSKGQTVEIGVTEGRVRFNRSSGDSIVVNAGTTWKRPVEAALEVEAPVPTVIPLPPMPAIPIASSRPISVSTPTASQSAIPTSAETNSTAEDTAYLHVLALEREGRRDEARLAAAQYLARFPNGFRRVEVRQIEAEVNGHQAPN